MFIFSKKFYGLFWAQSFGAFVDNFYKSFLLVWIVYQSSEISKINPRVLISLSSALFIIPFFIFSTIAGEMAAKYEKTVLIQKIKWFEICLVTFAILSVRSQSLLGMMSILFLLGTQAALFGPMKYSILPQLVDKEHLMQANGWVEMGTFIAILLGTLFGSLVLTFSHEFQTFAIVLLLASIIGLCFAYRIPPTNPENPEQKIKYNFLLQTMIQMIEMKRDNRMFWMIQMISWFWLLGVVILSIIPVIAKDVLHEGEKTVSVLLTCMSLFIGLGSVACHYVAKKIPPIWISFIAGILVMLMLFACSAAETLHWFLISLSVMSFFCGLYSVPLYTFLQKEPSVFLKSHLIAMMNIFNALWMIFGSVCLAIILPHSSVSKVFILLAMGSIIQTTFFGFRLKLFLNPNPV